MGFLYLGGLALLVGMAVGFTLGTAPRRVLLIVLAGALLAALFFGVAWLRAPRSAQDIDYTCSDCGMWLGRYWEGWLVLFFAVCNWIGWTVGVGLGAVGRWIQVARRDVREQRGVV